MNFMLRGLIMIVTQGKSIALLDTAGQPAPQAVLGRGLRLSGADLLGARLRRLRRVPVQPPPVRRTGAGGRRQSRQREQMGINVKRVRIATFVFMGLGAALAGVFSTMVNFTWWPTTGDGYLLPAIASVFVGGTPTWGGVGTIAGGAIGALTVSFIQTGIVGAGLERLLRPVLQRPDHHPGAARPSLEPEALSVGTRTLGSTSKDLSRLGSRRRPAGRRRALPVNPCDVPLSTSAQAV